MPLIDLSPVAAILPLLTKSADACLHTLALGVGLFMRTDHHQQAVDEIHGIVFEPLPGVGLAITGRDHCDARIYNLRKLRLSLQWLGTR